MAGEIAVYICPVDSCSFSSRKERRFIGHMAGTMQSDKAHRWENLPIEHHDLSAAKKKIVHTSLDDW